MPEAHVSEYKRKTVNEFIDLIKSYPIIAVVNMENMPAPQLQNMRAQLRNKVVLKMSKRRLMKLAIEQAKSSKKDIEKLEAHLENMPALLFTKENPFFLYKIIQKNKTSAPAKAGQTAPKDIIVTAGPTSFAPGPIIGQLGAVGIKTAVEGGKLIIKEDSVVAKKGEIISQNLASILQRLGIEPMEIGLDVVAVYENGTIFTKDVLAINEEEYIKKIQKADRWAFNLGTEIVYPTKRIVEFLIGKTFNDAKSLALTQNIITDITIKNILSRAEQQMLAIKNIANIKEIEKEEKKTEAKEEFEEKIEEKTKEEIKKEISQERKKEKEKKVEEKKDNKIKEKVEENKTKDDIPSVNELVKKTKEFEMGKKSPTAKEIVEGLNGKEEKKVEKVPTAHELAEKKKKMLKEG